MYLRLGRALPFDFSFWNGLKKVVVNFINFVNFRDCENDHPAYVVFQLDKVIDVNKETSYFEWQELQTDLGRLDSLIDVAFLKTVSAYFNKLLNQMLVVSDVNLAKYR